MVFGSFFKKKKKEEPESDIDDSESVLQTKEETASEPIAEHEDLENVKKESNEDEQSQRMGKTETDAKQMALKEVTVNIDSELLQKAQSRGIDFSSVLEQQLKKMVLDKE